MRRVRLAGSPMALYRRVHGYCGPLHNAASGNNPVRVDPLRHLRRIPRIITEIPCALARLLVQRTGNACQPFFLECLDRRGMPCAGQLATHGRTRGIGMSTENNVGRLCCLNEGMYGTTDSCIKASCTREVATQQRKR